MDSKNQKNDVCALIMAGGRGTRFWPKSTEEKPKQFLSLIHEKTMIQLTIDRVKKILPIEKIFIATAERYVDLVKEQLPELPLENIIVEPVGRNTAPCILLASLYIGQIYPNCNIMVLPSDHVIVKQQDFLDTLHTANDYVNANQEAIVTIGITPDRPETGYGYIQYPHLSSNDHQVIKIEKFVEKPDKEKAKEYLASGNYLWNAGMFIFNTNYMVKEIEKNLPKTFQLLSKLPFLAKEEQQAFLEENYPLCESISIDYAVMEKSNSIYVIPSNFGWDDIGTWQSLQRYMQPDENRNYIKGEATTYNSSNNVIYAGDKKIMLLDVDNLFCIEADDMIWIGRKESIEKVPEYRNKK